MANIIDIIVGKQAQAEVDKLIASLKLTHEEIIKINQQGLKINSGASPKNPTQMNQSVKDSIALTEKLDETTKKLTVTEKKLQTERIKELELQKKREQAVDKYNAQLEKIYQKQINESNKIIAQKEKEFSAFEKQFNKYEADLAKQVITEQNARKKQVQAILDQSKAIQSLQNQKEKELSQLDKENAKLEASLSLQSRTNAQLKTVQNAYDNLALKKARYNNLTENEEKRLITLTNTLQKYRSIQDGVNTTVGKFQQRVGSYVQSGFNPLSNSINQLTREMPAFTYSVQTGFMAISNNLPIFFDAMGNVIRQNKELQAQGKPTQSALMQLASSFFSLQTLMGVGITLLTVYGKEIGEFLVGSESKKKAIEAEKKAIEEKQKAEEEAFRTTASFQSDELSKSRILFENAKNLSLSYKERLKAVTELKNRYPDYLKQLSNEQILAGQTADAEERLNIALIGRGFALAAQQLLQKNIENEITLRLKNAKNEEKLLRDHSELFKNDANTVVINTDRKVRAEQQQEDFKKKTRQAQSDAYREQVRQLRDEREAILAQYNEYSKYLGAVNETTESKKKLKKANEDLKFGTESWLEAEISALEETRSKTATTSEAYKEIGGAIQYYQKWLETLIGTQKKSNEETEKTIKYGTIPYYEDLINKTKELQKLSTSNQEFAKLESQIKFYQELINEINGTSEATEDLKKVTNEYLEGFINDFSESSGFSKTFDILRDNIKDFGKDATVTALAISDAFQQAFNTISASSQASFDAEYTRLEQQKEISILFAGESASAKEEIERQYEEKRKAIQRRQAEAQKRLAIFNVAIDTAQAIVSALAEVAFPANIGVAALMGALGAAQIAMISSQEIPAFWKGTDNAPEGWALTQEKGAEVITDKNGKVKTLGNNKGAQMTYLNKGDKVYNAQKSEDYINKELAKNGIMLMGSSINPTRENNSLSKDDFNNGISKLAKTFKSQQPTTNTSVYFNNRKINTDYSTGKKV